MLNVKKLQAIRDKVLGVTPTPQSYGDLNSSVYLKQILDALLGTTSPRIQGNLNEKVYLQKIRNAIRGVPDGQFGSLSSAVYLQQVLNAFNGVADGKYGSLGENAYLDAVSAVARPVSTPWYLSGGIPAARCLAAYQPFGAASFAASKINLANPGTYNAVSAGGSTRDPSWSAARGWFASVDTGDPFVLASALAAASGQSLIASFRNVDITGAHVAAVGIENSLIVKAVLSGTLRIAYGGTQVSYGAGKANTILAICAGKPYIDGVLQAAIVPAAFSGNICPFGQPGRLGIFDVRFAAVYNTEITQAQVTALIAAMNALDP